MSGNEEPVAPELKIPKIRLETLTDGIFAIAMTLLVLSLEVPVMPANPTPPVINEYIINTLLPQIGIYIISFTILGGFWLNHHIFYAMKYTDLALNWLNIFWLMSIAIVPFSTSLMSNYGQYQFAEIIFALNMLVIGVLYYNIWHYAFKNEMIYEPVIPYAKIIKRSNLLLPVISLIAIGISFIIPVGTILIFILIPVLLNIRIFVKKRRGQSK
ncbi:TMEM175 family protein [uncultured Methanobacterium sp.]|uniref:TMEM175 family protein n=1 Tax=uncultured Methanobacterium sp. TaxID=176306 RepID=UPI002AA7DFDC|nr:TMEM175 family protein [uncultured Methanobacterium sp.]